MQRSLSFGHTTHLCKKGVNKVAQTFLLVHGSFHGAWCWRALERHLRAAGHDVFAPTLSGCAEHFHHRSAEVGLSTHVQDVVDFLFYEDLRDVIIVAHSSAGMLVPGIANATHDRLAGVVWLDAYVVPPGKKGFDLWSSERLAAARASIAAGDRFRQPFAPSMLGIEDPTLSAHVAERLTPHPLATYDEVVPSESEEAARLPRLYVACTSGPIASTFALIAQSVKDKGWPVIPLAAGHDAMLTHSAELAQILLNWRPEL